MPPSTPDRLSPPLAENRSALSGNSCKFMVVTRKNLCQDRSPTLLTLNHVTHGLRRSEAIKQEYYQNMLNSALKKEGCLVVVLPLT